MPPFPVDCEKDTICDVIRRWAKIQPDAPILVDEGCPPFSYGGLVNLMNEFGAALGHCGFGMGDRIAIVQRGGPQAASAAS